MKIKGGEEVLVYYSGDLIGALIDVFPDVTFEVWNFENVPGIKKKTKQIIHKQKYIQNNLLFDTDKYWRDAKNRKKWFIKLANKMEFDPLVASNWYSLPSINVAEFSVCKNYF